MPLWWRGRRGLVVSAQNISMRQQFQLFCWGRARKISDGSAEVVAETAVEGKVGRRARAVLVVVQLCKGVIQAGVAN